MEHAHILLVEDDPLVADVAFRNIKRAGFSIDAVRSGEEALDAMSRKTPDLILLDIVLPGLNGLDFLQAIRKDEKFHDVKVVIISNLGSRDDRDRGIILGADAYLVKSNVLPEDIVAEIRKILSKPRVDRDTPK